MQNIVVWAVTLKVNTIKININRRSPEKWENKVIQLVLL